MNSLTNWLARGYTPAHQHCDLFYPLGWGCDRVYHKLGNAPILRSETGSWVPSGQSVVRNPLSPLIRLGLRNPRKKERKNSTLGTCSKFVRKNKMLSLGVCLPQPCLSADRRFAASRLGPRSNCY